MDDTAIRPGLPPNPPLSTAIQEMGRPSPPPLPRPRRQKSWIVRVLEVVASLRITVVLLALAFVLVYFGTWAQMEADNWTVQKTYFRSCLVWIPIRVLFMYSTDIGGSVPFPGGWLIGSVLLANLLAAHAVRFKLSWKRSGILVLHAGIIVIMLGELITGLYAVEGNMTIIEGSQSNYVENMRLAEFAVVDRSEATCDREVVIPGQMLARSRKFEEARLPFDIEVNKYLSNADLRPVDADDRNQATAGIGRRILAIAHGAAAGDQPSDIEMPAAYVTLREKGTGKSLGTYLVSAMFGRIDRPMEEIFIDGKRYCFALRFQRAYRNFAVQLIEFKQEDYEGTNRPMSYSSMVAVKDPDNKQDFDYLIAMNTPLRYNGETYYQAQVYRWAKGTVLQVVHNPGYTLPYIACIMVAVGMLFHFGLHLIGFLRRRFQV